MFCSFVRPFVACLIQTVIPAPFLRRPIFKLLYADGHPEGRKVAEGLPPKSLRSPGNGRERNRARNVPTRPRDRTQEQVSSVWDLAIRESFWYPLLVVSVRCSVLFSRSCSLSLIHSLFLSLSHPPPRRLCCFLPFCCTRVVWCRVFRWLQEQVRLAKAEVVSVSKVEPIESVDVSTLCCLSSCFCYKV